MSHPFRVPEAASAATLPRRESGETPPPQSPPPPPAYLPRRSAGRAYAKPPRVQPSGTLFVSHVRDPADGPAVGGRGSDNNASSSDEDLSMPRPVCGSLVRTHAGLVAATPPRSRYVPPRQGLAGNNVDDHGGEDHSMRRGTDLGSPVPADPATDSAARRASAPANRPPAPPPYIASFVVVERGVNANGTIRSDRNGDNDGGGAKPLQIFLFAFPSALWGDGVGVGTGTSSSGSGSTTLCNTVTVGDMTNIVLSELRRDRHEEAASVGRPQQRSPPGEVGEEGGETDPLVTSSGIVCVREGVDRGLPAMVVRRHKIVRWCGGGDGTTQTKTVSNSNNNIGCSSTRYIPPTAVDPTVLAATCEVRQANNSDATNGSAGAGAVAAGVAASVMVPVDPAALLGRSASDGGLLQLVVTRLLPPPTTPSQTSGTVASKAPILTQSDMFRSNTSRTNYERDADDAAADFYAASPNRRVASPALFEGSDSGGGGSGSGGGGGDGWYEALPDRSGGGATAAEARSAPTASDGGAIRSSAAPAPAAPALQRAAPALQRAAVAAFSACATVDGALIGARIAAIYRQHEERLALLPPIPHHGIIVPPLVPSAPPPLPPVSSTLTAMRHHQHGHQAAPHGHWAWVAAAAANDGPVTTTATTTGAAPHMDDDDYSTVSASAGVVGTPARNTGGGPRHVSRLLLSPCLDEVQRAVTSGHSDVVEASTSTTTPRRSPSPVVSGPRVGGEGMRGPSQRQASQSPGRSPAPALHSDDGDALHFARTTNRSTFTSNNNTNNYNTKATPRGGELHQQEQQQQNTFLSTAAVVTAATTTAQALPATVAVAASPPSALPAPTGVRDFKSLIFSRSTAPTQNTFPINNDPYRYGSSPTGTAITAASPPPGREREGTRSAQVGSVTGAAATATAMSPTAASFSYFHASSPQSVPQQHHHPNQQQQYRPHDGSATSTTTTTRYANTSTRHAAAWTSSPSQQQHQQPHHQQQYQRPPVAVYNMADRSVVGGRSGGGGGVLFPVSSSSPSSFGAVQQRNHPQRGPLSSASSSYQPRPAAATATATAPRSLIFSRQ